MVYETRYSDSLTHYGIKGQKWGVRRFQRKDGTLTEAGKKRKAKYEEDLDRLNSDMLTNRIVVQKANQTNDPRTQVAAAVYVRDIEKASKSGKRIVDHMKKKGLVSDNTTFDDYTAKYERKVRDNCKKYIGDTYGIKNPTDDVVDYLFPTYVLTGRR